MGGTFEDVRHLYTSGRILNLLLNIGSSYFIFQIAQNFLKISRKYDILLTLCSFTLFTVHHFAFRPDSLKAFFLVICSYYVFIYLKSSKTHVLLIASLFASLSILSKQDALIITLGIGFILLAYNGIKSAFMFTSITFIFVLIFLGQISCWNFENLYSNLVTGISQGSSFDWFFLMVKTNSLQFSGMLILYLYVLWGNNSISKYFKFILLIISALIFMSATKWGSDMNYFWELQVILFFICIYTVDRQNSRLNKSIILLCFLLIFTGNLWRSKVRIFSYWDYLHGKSRYESYLDYKNQIIKCIENNNIKYVISFDINLNIHLVEYAILGTTVNDYPEAYFPGIEKIVNDLPEKPIFYRFNCSKSNEIAIISKLSSFEQDAEYIKTIFQTDFDLIPLSNNLPQDYNLYYLVCK